MIKKESLNKLIIVAIVLCAIVTIFLTYNKHEENQKPELRDTIIVRRDSISKEIDTIYREIQKSYAIISHKVFQIFSYKIG